MDFASTFRAEVFRPVAVLIVPGAIASFPYFMLATKYYPDLAIYRDSHEVPYYAISFLIVLAVGLLLEDLGSLIEADVWDKKLERDHELKDTWRKYLMLTLEKEPIGQRYLRAMVLRLKFELGCSVAFVSFLVGMGWLNLAFPLMSWFAYFALALGVVVTGAYLLWESYRGAKVLATLRKALVASHK
jgi:hypothetical protein